MTARSRGIEALIETLRNLLDALAQEQDQRAQSTQPLPTDAKLIGIAWIAVTTERGTLEGPSG